MLAAGRGDQRAFEALVTRHHDGLLALFLRRGLDRHAAEDCVQDTFLRLLGAADSYRPRAPFQGFLVRLAVNTLIDWDALGISPRLAAPIARARRELGGATPVATATELESAALMELGPLGQDGFGALPATAADLLAALSDGR